MVFFASASKRAPGGEELQGCFGYKVSLVLPRAQLWRSFPPTWPTSSEALGGRGPPAPARHPRAAAESGGARRAQRRVPSRLGSRGDQAGEAGGGASRRALVAAKRLGGRGVRGRAARGGAPGARRTRRS